MEDILQQEEYICQEKKLKTLKILVRLAVPGSNIVVVVESKAVTGFSKEVITLVCEYRLAVLRDENIHLNDEGIAERVHLSPSLLAKWKGGHSTPTKAVDYVRLAKLSVTRTDFREYSEVLLESAGRTDELLQDLEDTFSSSNGDSLKKVKAKS